MDSHQISLKLKSVSAFRVTSSMAQPLTVPSTMLKVTASFSALLAVRAAFAALTKSEKVSSR